MVQLLEDFAKEELTFWIESSSSLESFPKTFDCFRDDCFFPDDRSRPYLGSIEWEMKEIQTSLAEPLVVN